MAGPAGGGAGRSGPAVLVTGLLVVAALALPARSGLDWDSLDDPGRVAWARVVPAALLLVALGLQLRRLLNRLRRATRPLDGDPDRERTALQVPVLFRAAALLLVLLALLLAWWVAGQFAAPEHAESPADLPPEGPPPPPDGAPRSWSWLVLLALLVGLPLAVVLLQRLRLRDFDRHELAGPGPAEAHPRADSPALAAAVADAEAAVTAHADPRHAIVAAYRAMASRLDRELLQHSGRASTADTPTERLDRAVAAGLVAADPARTLTELFREARFSRHPLTTEHRDAAARALAEVAADLQPQEQRR